MIHWNYQMLIFCAIVLWFARMSDNIANRKIEITLAEMIQSRQRLVGQYSFIGWMVFFIFAVSSFLWLYKVIGLGSMQLIAAICLCLEIVLLVLKLIPLSWVNHCRGTVFTQAINGFSELQSGQTMRLRYADDVIVARIKKWLAKNYMTDQYEYVYKKNQLLLTRGR